MPPGFFFLQLGSNCILRCPRALFKGLEIVKSRDTVRFFFLRGKNPSTASQDEGAKRSSDTRGPGYAPPSRKYGKMDSKIVHWLCFCHKNFKIVGSGGIHPLENLKMDSKLCILELILP